MKIVEPYLIKDSDATTNATESVAAWSNVTAYTTGQQASFNRRVWEAIRNNTNKTPGANPLDWFDVRPMNQWAMFDDRTGTQTVRASPLIVTVDVDGFVDTVGLLNIAGSVLNLDAREGDHVYTNLLLWSEDFSNLVWDISQATIDANAALAPSGEMTADNLIEAATNDYHLCGQVTTLSDSVVTGSIFVKDAGRSKLRLALSNDAGGDCLAVFDLAAETAVISYESADLTDASCLIEPYGDGFYRCSITATKGALVNSTVRLQLIMLNAAGAALYAGDGVSGYYVWGAQLEEGPLSQYIPTTTAPVSVTGQSVFSQTINLNNDLSGITDYYEYFFNPIDRITDSVITLPPDLYNLSITMTLTDVVDVAIGQMIVGQARWIGNVQYGARLSGTDYSRVEEDEFGNTYISKRAYNRTGRFVVWLDADRVDGIYNIVTGYRATPVMVIATEKYASSFYYGLLRDAEIEIAYPKYSLMSLEVRGI